VNPTSSSSRTMAHPWKRLQQQGRRSKAADRSPWLVAPPWSILCRRRQRGLHGGRMWRRRSIANGCISAMLPQPLQLGRMCDAAHRRCNVMQLTYWTDCRYVQVLGRSSRTAVTHCCNSSSLSNLAVVAVGCTMARTTMLAWISSMISHVFCRTF